MTATRPRRRLRPARAAFGLSPADQALVATVALVALVATARRFGARLEVFGRPLVFVPIAATVLLLAVVAVAHRTRRGRVKAVTAPEGWARRRDLSPLLVAEGAGDRVTLGRLGRHLVAAETLQSVLVVGPSQCGKTTGLAIPAISGWGGPVLATSVKADLVSATHAVREAGGEVAVFDPAGVTGLAAVSWSPLSEATSWSGARRVAEALCSIGKRPGGMEDSGYWYATAERLLAPMLRAASLAGCSMGDVVSWLEEDPADDLVELLRTRGERDAARQLSSVAVMDERQRTSVLSTAHTVVAAYGDPQVRACELRGRPLEPGWLLSGGRRTLYLCAPAREQSRLSPVFVALVRHLLDEAFTRSAAAAAPLSPGLLVVLDEAANIAPLPELDQVLSTAVGHGICLLTVWQDLAQAEARYGAGWATIVNNHRAKVVFPGVSDPRTLELVSALVGEGEATQLSRSRSGDGSWSESESATRVPLGPAGTIRCLPAGSCLLLYGSMPPALVSVAPAAPSDQPAGRWPMTGAPGRRSTRWCSARWGRHVMRATPRRS